MAALRQAVDNLLTTSVEPFNSLVQPDSAALAGPTPPVSEEVSTPPLTEGIGAATDGAPKLDPSEEPVWNDDDATCLGEDLDLPDEEGSGAGNNLAYKFIDRLPVTEEDLDTFGVW